MSTNPSGKGKYVFDFGCEQLGEYLRIEQDKEEKGEDDEPLPTVIPKWKAGKTQAITIQTEEEELEELQQLPTDNMISESQEEPKSEVKPPEIEVTEQNDDEKPPSPVQAEKTEEEETGQQEKTEEEPVQQEEAADNQEPTTDNQEPTETAGNQEEEQTAE